jgi:hypothetical protein
MKWTKVVPLKNMMHREEICFISEHTIHRFGIPQILTMDQGSSFMFLAILRSGQWLD